MAKKNVISVKALEECIKANCQCEIAHIKWYDLDVEVKPRLSLTEMIHFTEGVVRSCFDIDTGEYIPEAKDFAVGCNIIDYYTNISMPKNTSLKYEMICSMKDLMDKILATVDADQYAMIASSIEEKIEMKIKIASAPNVSPISDFVHSIGEILGKLGGLSELVEGMDSKDIKKALGSIFGDLFESSEDVETPATLGMISGGDVAI